MATHRVITEVTFKVVLDLNMDELDKKFPGEVKNQLVQEGIQMWKDTFEEKFNKEWFAEMPNELYETQYIEMI